MACAPAPETPHSTPAEENAVDRDVAELLGSMTLEEKVAQLTCLWEDKNLILDDDGRFDPEKAAAVIPPRDPRWGRIEETYGEDPHLVAEMGLASVRGFQGGVQPLVESRRSSPAR